MNRVDRRWSIVHRIKRGAQISCQLCFLLWTMVYGLWTSSANAELSNGMDADFVIGQPDFQSNTGRVTQNGVSNPNAIVNVGDKLIVADQGGHRVLIWNTIPKSSNTPADVVLGQPDFTSNAADNGGISAATLDSPPGVFSDGTRLFVSDRNNHRLLIWNSIPTSNFTPADVVVGQTNFTGETANQGGAAAANTINRLEYGCTDGTRLFIADNTNHRLLIFNSIPTQNNASADVVLGQPDFATTTGGASQRKMGGPYNCASDGKRLFVLEGNRPEANNRILIWNSIPTENFAPADVVVGQPNFTSGAANAGGLGPYSFSTRFGGTVYSDGVMLFLADRGNHRVMIWNQIPIKNFTPADVVVGQPDFTSNTANNGGISSRTLSSPMAPYFNGHQLFIGDEANRRVLVFNVRASESIDLGPQFSQGKAVVGKVYWDMNADGIQQN